MKNIGSQLGGYSFLLLIQFTFIVVYGIFVRYDDKLLPQQRTNVTELEVVKMEHVPSYPRK